MSNNNEKNPLVSVYIPTKNRPKLLKRAIDSVMKQTYKNIELVICSDGYDDETDKLVKKISQSYNIKYLINNDSGGACSTRNKAILNCSGMFITGLDDDDVFTKERIDFFVNKWDEKFSFLASRGSAFNENRSFLNKILSYMKKDKKVSLEEVISENVIGNQVFTLKSRFVDCLFDPNLPALQDWELWLRFVKCYGEAYVFKNELQRIDTSHQYNRISSMERRLNALDIIKEKHKIEDSKLMNIKTTWKVDFNLFLDTNDVMILLENKSYKYLLRGLFNNILWFLSNGKK